MTATLYVETNFLIAFAKGQDEEVARLVAECPLTVRIAVPSICFMEALSVLEAERKARRRLINDLETHAREAGRDMFASVAITLRFHLESAAVESIDLLDEIERRLEFVLKVLAGTAELIDLRKEMILAAVGSHFTDDPTDNLILACIADHAASRPDSAKAFVSANARDYNRPDVLDLLDRSGVRYFSDPKAALGWLAASPES